MQKIGIGFVQTVALSQHKCVADKPRFDRWWNKRYLLHRSHFETVVRNGGARNTWINRLGELPLGHLCGGPADGWHRGHVVPWWVGQHSFSVGGQDGWLRGSQYVRITHGMVRLWI